MKRIIGLSIGLLLLAGCGAKKSDEVETSISTKQAEKTSETSQVKTSSKSRKEVFDVDGQSYSMMVSNEFENVEDDDYPFDIENEEAEVFIDYFNREGLDSFDELREIFLAGFLEEIDGEKRQIRFLQLI